MRHYPLSFWPRQALRASYGGAFELKNIFFSKTPNMIRNLTWGLIHNFIPVIPNCPCNPKENLQVTGCTRFKNFHSNIYNIHIYIQQISRTIHPTSPYSLSHFTLTKTWRFDSGSIPQAGQISQILTLLLCKFTKVGKAFIHIFQAKMRTLGGMFKCHSFLQRGLLESPEDLSHSSIVSITPTAI